MSSGEWEYADSSECERCQTREHHIQPEVVRVLPARPFLGMAAIPRRRKKPTSRQPPDTPKKPPTPEKHPPEDAFPNPPERSFDPLKGAAQPLHFLHNVSHCMMNQQMAVRM